MTPRGRRLVEQSSKVTIDVERHLYEIDMTTVWPKHDPDQPDPVFHLNYDVGRALPVVGAAHANADSHPHPEAVTWGAYTSVHSLLDRAREVEKQLEEVAHA